MVNIFNSCKFNKLFIHPTLVCFTLTCALPFPVHAEQFQQERNFFDQVALMIRLEKIVERLMKQEKKGKDPC